MAGITDQPFRRLCAHYGAGLIVFRDDVHQPTSLAYREIETSFTHSEELGIKCGANRRF